MARPRQPVNLLEATGRKHLTRAESDDRHRQEPRITDDSIECPAYIDDEDERLEFMRYAHQLASLRIWAAIDADELARYVTAETLYEAYSVALRKAVESGDMEQAGHIQRQQDKAFRQAHTSASSLGMTIASRCRLVVPKVDDEETDF